MVTIIDDVLPKTFVDEIVNQNIDFHETWQNGIGSIKQWIYVCAKQPSDKVFVLLKQALNYLQDKTGIKIKDIHRCKLNIIKPMNISHDVLDNMIHIDTDPEPNVTYKSIIFYLNDADGDTVFFDNNKKEIDRCSPQLGRAVIFDSTMFHRATPPTSKDRRVINFLIEI